MKEIQSIIKEYHRLEKDQLKMAMAIVVHVEDSSYRRSGARMLISEDGQWTGGVSGGCLEGDILKKAQKSIYDAKSTVVRYDTRAGDSSEIGVGLGCKGLIDILIVPIKDGGIISQLEKQALNRQASINVIVVKAEGKEEIIGKHLQYHEDESIKGIMSNPSLAEELKRDISKVRQKRKSITKNYGKGLESGSEFRIFIEYLPPAIHLFIFGRNYDSIPLARIAKEVGWKVTIGANPLKVPKTLYEIADAVSNPENVKSELDENSVALLVSHDFNRDKYNLEFIADSSVAYIGLLGPKKRLNGLSEQLSKVTMNKIANKLYGPIGLDTGATTPEEIAISILAEIRAHFNNRSGGFLRNRTKPINDRF